MVRQRLKQQREGLSRFLIYVLGHRPDEFGLFPDEEGFIPVKELLAAVKEEEGWTFLRESHFEELLREPEAKAFEARGKTIRVRPENSGLEFGPLKPSRPPALLYHAARRKAYPVILEHGLQPGARPWAPLFTTKEMALRVGRRRDPDPVMLTIQAGRAEARGTIFHRFQENIFLVESIPAEFITGPALPQEKGPAKEKKEPLPPAAPRYPGSFFLDPEHDPDLSRRPGKEKDREKKRGKDGPDWKRAARKMRREKNRGE